MEKTYKVKVTEMHTDVVYVKADSQEKAKDLAVAEAFCVFDCTYDCEVLEEMQA